MDRRPRRSLECDARVDAATTTSQSGYQLAAAEIRKCIAAAAPIYNNMQSGIGFEDEVPIVEAAGLVSLSGSCLNLGPVTAVGENYRATEYLLCAGYFRCPRRAGR